MEKKPSNIILKMANIMGKDKNGKKMVAFCENQIMKMDTKKVLKKYGGLMGESNQIM